MLLFPVANHITISALFVLSKKQKIFLVKSGIMGKYQ